MLLLLLLLFGEYQPGAIDGNLACCFRRLISRSDCSSGNILGICSLMGGILTMGKIWCGSPLPPRICRRTAFLSLSSLAQLGMLAFLRSASSSSVSSSSSPEPGDCL